MHPHYLQYFRRIGAGLKEANISNNTICGSKTSQLERKFRSVQRNCKMLTFITFNVSLGGRENNYIILFKSCFTVIICHNEHGLTIIIYHFKHYLL